MFKQVIIAGLGIAALAGCAKTPESIAPASTSTIPYQRYSCGQIGQEERRLSSALTTAYTQQNNARTNDVVGVILIGLPVSTLSGDNIAPQIAKLKGEREALQKVAIRKRCNVRFRSITPPKPKVKSQPVNNDSR